MHPIVPLEARDAPENAQRLDGPGGFGAAIPAGAGMAEREGFEPFYRLEAKSLESVDLVVG